MLRPSKARFVAAAMSVRQFQQLSLSDMHYPAALQAFFEGIVGNLHYWQDKLPGDESQRGIYRQLHQYLLGDAGMLQHCHHPPGSARSQARQPEHQPTDVVRVKSVYVF